MSRRSFDLVVVCGFAAVAVVVTLLGVPVLRVVMGVPLVLVVPGYALVAALFPGVGLRVADRLLLVLGLSMALVIVSGLLLNLMPWGLQVGPWVGVLAVITGGGCAVAFVRRGQEEVGPLPVAWSLPVRVTRGQVIMVGLAVAVAAGALAFARDEARRQPSADVIELWMLPGDGGDSGTVRVGVSSVGGHGVFRLVVMRGGFILHEWSELTIVPDQQWEQTVVLGRHQPGRGPFEARLYRRADPGVVFRQVSLWPEDQP